MQETTRKITYAQILRYDMHNFGTYAGQWSIEDTTPSAAATPYTDFDATADVITEVDHGFETGTKAQWTTDDTLPTGLSLATDYFVIRIGEDSYQVASSLANALAGTAVNFTDQGAGNHTLTPVAIAGGVTQFMWSNRVAVLGDDYSYDADDWVAISSESSEGTATILIENPEYRILGLRFGITAGQQTVVESVRGLRER